MEKILEITQTLECDIDNIPFVVMVRYIFAQLHFAKTLTMRGLINVPFVVSRLQSNRIEP